MSFHVAYTEERRSRWLRYTLKIERVIHVLPIYLFDKEEVYFKYKFNLISILSLPCENVQVALFVKSLDPDPNYALAQSD